MLAQQCVKTLAFADRVDVTCRNEVQRARAQILDNGARGRDTFGVPAFRCEQKQECKYNADTAEHPGHG